MTEETKVDYLDAPEEENSDADAYAILSLAIIAAIAFVYYVGG